MAKYRARPIEVEAYRIDSVATTRADCSVDVNLENGTTEVATAAMCARMAPKAGDYWVIQPDGYIYLNPKEVFERKYERLP